MAVHIFHDNHSKICTTSIKKIKKSLTKIEQKISERGLNYHTHL